MFFVGASTNKAAIMTKGENFVDKGYVVVIIKRNNFYELYRTTSLDTPTVFIGGWTRERA